MSKAFWIILIFVLVIGGAILAWSYRPWEIKKTTPPSPVSTPTSESVESQLSDIEEELNEANKTASELDLQELESLEGDLDPSQFDVL